MLPVTIIMVVAVALAVATATGYNALQHKRRRCLEAWRQVHAALRRRWDLVPSAIETISRHADNESEVLDRAREARDVAAVARGVQACSEAERVLWTAMQSAMALAEQHGQLQADPDFAKARDEMIRISNRIALAEQQYNEVVRLYNNALSRGYHLPVAAVFRFGPQVGAQIMSTDSLSGERGS